MLLHVQRPANPTATFFLMLVSMSPVGFFPQNNVAMHHVNSSQNKRHKKMQGHAQKMLLSLLGQHLQAKKKKEHLKKPTMDCHFTMKYIAR